MSASEPPWVHPGAIVEDGVVLGRGTRVWDGAHLRRGARVGRHCILGEKTYVAYDAVIGDHVKLNASVYVCAGVTVEDFVMLSAHVVFTNDRFPRAGNVDLTGLETSDPTDETCATRVRRGVTVGANTTVGPGLELGEFSMVGMGSVVTRDVLPHALVVGNPARQVGWVCVCGHKLAHADARVASGRDAPLEGDPRRVRCGRCGRDHLLDALGLRLVGEARRRTAEMREA